VTFSFFATTLAIISVSAIRIVTVYIVRVIPEHVFLGADHHGTPPFSYSTSVPVLQCAGCILALDVCSESSQDKSIRGKVVIAHGNWKAANVPVVIRAYVLFAFMFVEVRLGYEASGARKGWAPSEFATTFMEISIHANLVITKYVRRIVPELSAIWALHHGTCTLPVSTSLRVLFGASRVLAFDFVGEEFEDIFSRRRPLIAELNWSTASIPVHVKTSEAMAVNSMTMGPGHKATWTAVSDAFPLRSTALGEICVNTVSIVAQYVCSIMPELVTFFRTLSHGAATFLDSTRLQVSFVLAGCVLACNLRGKGFENPACSNVHCIT
jgi:hypothetical protein